MNYNSVNFFLESFKTNIVGLNLNEWAVTSVGSGNIDDFHCWVIFLKNKKTKEEKNIRIPCHSA